MRAQVMWAACAAATLASPSMAQWNDVATDLPNVPFGAPIWPVNAPGVEYVAFGAIFTGQVDIDFITILININTPTLIVDVDCLVPTQDSLLGIGLFNQYPNVMVNDDDLDGPEDFMGVTNHPLDSAFDVTAFLGGPITAGTLFTIAITRSGDVTWQGTDPFLAKLEWQLRVYTAVPAPGAACALAAGGLLAVRRRRR